MMNSVILFIFLFFISLNCFANAVFTGPTQPQTAYDTAANLLLSDCFEKGDVVGAELNTVREGSYAGVIGSDGVLRLKQPDIRFEIECNYLDVEAEPNPTPTPVVIDPPVPVFEENIGFTEIKPSNDSRLIYVSNSDGSDSNDCLSQNSPCKTLSNAMEKMRNGCPDHVYLKRGDAWIDQNLNGVQGGRSTEEPSVVAFYGEGERPIIGNAGRDGILLNNTVNNINFIGLHFYAYKMDPDNSEFDGKTGSSVVFRGGFDSILIEDTVFDLSELKIGPWTSGSPSNFTLRRNIWTGAYINTSSEHHKKRPSNLFVSGVDGLVIEENVFDYGGWHPTVSGAGANTRNHNLYIVDNNVSGKLFVRNNIITRGSSHGIHGRPGGTYENNFFGRNSVQMGVGYSKVEMAPGEFAVVLNNVISETASMYKGSPVSKVTNGAVWGLVISQKIGNPDFIRIERNIIAHDISGGGTRRAYQKNGYSAVEIDNVIWDFNTADSFEGDGLFAGPYPDPDRTLGSYNETIGGNNSFDEFMEVVKNRPIQTWDDRYTAKSINDYIRAGFGLEN